ncbi:MAG: glycosyltransferase [Armatimonadetes bacterium]|nr:glycosyltransferase [Armatimonadota bacterium]
MEWLRDAFGFEDCEPPHCGKPDCGHCGWPPHCCNPPHQCSWWSALLFVWLILLLPFYWCTDHKPKPSKPGRKDGEPLRVAYVSVWGIPCGISTYNEELVPQLREHIEVKVFAEYADPERSERLERDPDWVIRCWTRNEHPKSKLMQALTEYDPDVVHIGHEYGFFARAYMFTSLVTWLKGRRIPVVTTFHSVYAHQDKVVTESSAPSIIVHTDAGKQCLVDKGIEASRVSVIPHGTEILAGTPEVPELLPNLWNTWHTQHTIFHPGFMFGYKGHLRMLGIVARLKEKYPDVHYIIQGSENPNNMREHDELYQKIISRSEELGLSSNVTVNRGFVSKEVLLSFIRTMRVCVLPYQSHPDHEVRATSGIARVVAGTQTPLVVSSAHLFDDLTNVAVKCKTDDDLFQAIDDVFSSNRVKESQVMGRTKFLRETSWRAVARRTLDVYKTLLRSNTR